MKPTGYYTHRLCRKHDMGRGHPEAPQRLDVIEDRLLITGVSDALDRREPNPASVAELELAHDRMYIASLRGLSAQLADDIRAGGPTHVQLDPDTSMCEHTWQAALLSAGAAIDATDAVLEGEIANAFCATRPGQRHAAKSTSKPRLRQAQPERAVALHAEAINFIAASAYYISARAKKYLKTQRPAP